MTTTSPAEKTPTLQASPAPGPSCLTIPEAAAELRIAKSSVYELIKRKELRAINVLGKKRIRRTDLLRFLEFAGSDKRTSTR